MILVRCPNGGNDCPHGMTCGASIVGLDGSTREIGVHRHDWGRGGPLYRMHAWKPGRDILVAFPRWPKPRYCEGRVLRVEEER